MNDQTTYRKILAASLLLLIFAVDLAAVHQLFGSVVQVAIFGAFLGVQTLLILAYHQRCLECEGCMDKAGKGIYLFYKVFAIIGFFSTLIILLNDVFAPENGSLKIAVAITYAALLITGASTAFNAIIGVRNVSGCTSAPTNTEAKAKPTQREIEAKALEAKVLADLQAEEAARRKKSLIAQKRQAIAREQAKKRLEQRNNSVRTAG